MTDKNVMIPLSLFNSTIDVLESLSQYNWADDFRLLLDNVLAAFQYKKQSIALRDYYAKIVFAKTDDERSHARMLYLAQRRRSSSRNS